MGVRRCQYNHFLCIYIPSGSFAFPLVQLQETYVHGKVRGIMDCLIKQQLEDIDNGRTVTFTYERIVCAALETVAAG